MAVTSHPSTSATYVVGSSQGTATDLSHAAIGGLRTRPNSRYFHADDGRVLIPRGCNVSGLNKLPTSPDGRTHLSEGFYDTEHVSFVGRPFPLDEAPEHLARLKLIGHTFLRLVITWESLEHEGPGIYDTDYIDYLVQLISLMPAYGIKCYIDAHQDVWCRHTGGSGAPHWTLGLVGLDIRNLKATGAAHAHNLHLEPNDPPPKVWPSGYTKLAAATMATVFWAGGTFAPKRRVSRRLHRLWKNDEDKDVDLQEFLQQSMIEAFGALADKVNGLESVVGFEVINEPHRGYVELLSPFAFDFNTDLHIGFVPSAVESWALGSGHSVLVDHYGPSFPVTARTHQVLISPPTGRTAWKSDSSCIWQEHGVWGWDPKRGEVGEPVSLRNEYFDFHPQTGKKIDWYRDFYWPFSQKFGDRMLRANDEWHTMVGPIPNEFCPEWPVSHRPRHLVYAPHWYDLQSLFEKALGTMSANVQGLSRGMFLPKALYFGRAGLKKNYALQIRNIIEAGYRSLGEQPIIIGETGIPFDMNAKQAFKSGDYQWQERGLDGIFSALESSLVPFNIWNYNPHNNNEHGDSWNAEDFSFFSLSSATDEVRAAAKTEDERLYVGMRTLNAVERPYAAKIAGIPTFTSYDLHTRRYIFRYSNPAVSPSAPKRIASTAHPPLEGEAPRARETEIYLPRRRYAEAAKEGKLVVELRKGSQAEWKYDEERQTLYVLHGNTEPGFEHSVTVSIEGEGDDFGLSMNFVVVSLLVALLGGVISAWYLNEQQSLY